MKSVGKKIKIQMTRKRIYIYICLMQKEFRSLVEDVTVICKNILRVHSTVAILFCLFVLNGCGILQDNQELLDAFLAGEIPARYDENSDFTYRDEEISMKEYEELRKQIFGW